MTDHIPDDEFERLLRDAAHSYHRPPDLPATEDLWAAIDAQLPLAERPHLTVVRGTPSRRRAWLANPWLRTAAGILIGVALGRASVARAPQTAPTVAQAAAEREGDTTPNTPNAPNGVPGLDRVATTEYLGRTAALLAALPDELKARRADPTYHSQADALLLQTRLLLDSPAAADPQLRSLFDDLEIVLAQVVRLRADRDPTRVELLQQSLEQRDVLPRIRDAVADNAAD
jgi:hypothetical protein